MPNNFSYYSIREIYDQFTEYRKIDKSDITDQEYKILCEWLWYVPKNTVDRIKLDIEFILLSAKKSQVACYTPLKDVLNKKRGIIFISSILIAGMQSNLPRAKEEATKKFLHEVAHFELDHPSYESEAHKKQIEKEADELALKWFEQRSKMDPSKLV